jgi:hypothetical protein
MDGTEPIVGYVEKRIRVTGYDRRLGAGVANQLDPWGKIAEVFRIPHIPMKEGDAVVLDHGDVSFAAPPNKIIHHRNFVPFFAKVKCDMRTDKAATTGYEYMQEVILLSGHFVAKPDFAFSHQQKSR